MTSGPLLPSILLLLPLACAERPPPAAPPALPSRTIWITRWDYRTETDVRTVVENCHRAGFDELLFQVRGNATTFFPSTREPWAEELGGADPGFDPLALALELAHERGLSLQAWVNVVPAWWGDVPPVDPEHVVNRHPEWLWYDAEGERQPYSKRFYVSLNPCLPEVRAHLVLVLEELAQRYPVDGLHLDYIRFPNEPPATPPGVDYPRDARTLEPYRAAVGLAPDDDPEAWNRWRSEQLTLLVREIRAAVRSARPAARLSAAVGAEPEAAARHFQDWPRWIEEGLVDQLFPMNYTGDEERYRGRLAAWQQRRGSVRVSMGLSATSSEPAVLRRRIAECRESFGGVALFGYLYLWDSRNTVIDVQNEERSAERAALRGALLPLDP